MNWRGSKLLKHFIQYLLILLAWYTCLSRISDYKHHWSDVLAGGVLGSTVAIVISKYCTDLFDARRKTASVLPQTRYELNPNHTTSNGSQQPWKHIPYKSVRLIKNHCYKFLSRRGKNQLLYLLYGNKSNLFRRFQNFEESFKILQIELFIKNKAVILI